jgi:zinc/manganese transport system permease protein
MIWILAPFLVCVVLSCVHALLGFRVIARNIIFLDLALAQLAAFGATLGLAFGLSPEGAGMTVTAMAMTTIGAVFFTFIPEKYRGVSQEVVIGLVYVMAVAGVVIAIRSSPAEAHHLTDMLVGNILFVSLSDVGSLAIYYGALIAIYAGLRRVVLSRLPQGSRWHDFVFYVFFGWVVTSSVKVAGVLLVFVFLIVPAVAALWWGIQRPFYRWLFALVFGMLFSALGLLLSVVLDWPTGAAIVLAAGAMVSLLRIVVSMFNRRLKTTKPAI